MSRPWLLRGLAGAGLLILALGLSHVLGSRAPAPRPPLLVLGSPSEQLPGSVHTATPASAGPSGVPTVLTLAGPTGSVAPPARRPSPAAAVKAVPPGRSTLVLGTIGTFSGAGSERPSAARRGLTAWAIAANARGGVAGHPVRLVAVDDRGDPAVHLSGLNRLLGEGVVALVGLSGDESDDRQLLDGRGVPVLGALPWSATTLGGFPDFAPSGTSPDALTFGGLVEARAAGGSRLAVLRCPGSAPRCSRERSLVVTGGYARQAGLQVGYDATATPKGETADCRAMKRARVDTVYVAADGDTLRRVAAACRAVGAAFRYVAGELASTTSATGLPDGTVAVQPTLPWTVVTGAAGAERSAGLRAARVPLDASSAQGWVAGELAERLVRIAVARQGSHPAAVTGPQLRAAAGSLRAETLGGLAPPLTGAARGPAPASRCWFLVAARAGGWVAPRGGAVRCGGRP